MLLCFWEYSLTLGVSVASSERSPSKHTLIKTHLRSSTGQLRLTNLVILSVEHDMTETVDFDDIMSDFAQKQVRRIGLQ